MPIGGDTSFKSPIADQMRQPRRDVLDLTMYLLGFNPYGGAPAQGGGMGTGQGVGQRGVGRNPFGATGQPGPIGGGWSSAGQAGQMASFTPSTPPSFGDPTGRLESFFGPLTSGLQRQSVDLASKYLSQQLPQERALEAMYGQLDTNPGQGVMDALQPRYQQNLATARQSGARFGSGTAIREAQAANDYNLLSAQALQQGVTQQQEAAKIVNMLGQGIQETWANAAALGDTETQRRLQIMLNLLQTIQGATFGVNKTAVSEPGVLDTIGSFAGNVGGAAAGLGWKPFA